MAARMFLLVYSWQRICWKKIPRLQMHANMWFLFPMVTPICSAIKMVKTVGMTTQRLIHEQARQKNISEVYPNTIIMIRMFL